MDYKALFGILVSIFSFGMVFIGIPSQIMKNYKEKRSGQSLVLTLIAIGFYISQVGYFAITEAYIALLPLAIGLLMWFIILIQYLLYKNKMKK